MQNERKTEREEEKKKTDRQTKYIVSLSFDIIHRHILKHVITRLNQNWLEVQVMQSSRDTSFTVDSFNRLLDTQSELMKKGDKEKKMTK